MLRKIALFLLLSTASLQVGATCVADQTCRRVVSSSTGTVKWYGLSSVTKPAATDVPFPVGGDYFIQTDGGAEYIWDGTTWNLVTAGGGGGSLTMTADGFSYGAGESEGIPTMGAYDSTPDNCTDNKLCIAGITQKRALKATLFDTSGNEVTSLGGGTQYAVDTALGATPTGNVNIFKRDDALSALTPVEGDAIEGRVDANGAIWVTMANSTGARISPALEAGGNLDSIATSLTDVASWDKAEDSAHVTADKGIPAWGVAGTFGTAFAAAGDYTPIATNTDGSVHVAGQSNTCAVYTADQNAIKGGAGVLSSVTVSGATAGDEVKLVDSLTTTGTAIYDFKVSTTPFNVPSIGGAFATGLSLDVTISSAIIVTVCYR